jgi:hypothetical protein
MPPGFEPAQSSIIIKYGRFPRQCSLKGECILTNSSRGIRCEHPFAVNNVLFCHSVFDIYVYIYIYTSYTWRCPTIARPLPPHERRLKISLAIRHTPTLLHCLMASGTYPVGSRWSRTLTNTATQARLRHVAGNGGVFVMRATPF